ncbi:MAG: hypothetical protein Ct9H300mP2_2030 [Candidatus Neomarinimicrobiota bacterium]|nr:MAG: hypothetical protein Ct9H300mP2_2030 [Candidatus Neomarinimicrobiota bacterium]
MGLLFTPLGPCSRVIIIGGAHTKMDLGVLVTLLFTAFIHQRGCSRCCPFRACTVWVLARMVAKLDSSKTSYFNSCRAIILPDDMLLLSKILLSRLFFFTPVLCCESIPQKQYKGETTLLLFQNLHRYTWYIALAFVLT